MENLPTHIKVNGNLYKKAATEVVLVKKQKGDGGQTQEWYKTPDGQRHFIVSYAPRVDETLVFEGNDQGKIVSYSELGGIGGEGFDEALQSAGLVVVASVPTTIRVKGRTYRRADEGPAAEGAIPEPLSPENILAADMGLPIDDLKEYKNSDGHSAYDLVKKYLKES